LDTGGDVGGECVAIAGVALLFGVEEEKGRCELE
jgi:hypothetical protein